MIKELLETRIRPAVQEDGGDITFTVSHACSLSLCWDCLHMGSHGAHWPAGCAASRIALLTGAQHMKSHLPPCCCKIIDLHQVCGLDTLASIGEWRGMINPEVMAVSNRGLIFELLHEQGLDCIG